jgi:hypothetical protein
MSLSQNYPNSSCPFEHLGALGDGFCHDELNIETCNFDGNDCCLPEVKTNVCSDCTCKNDKTSISNYSLMIESLN